MRYDFFVNRIDKQIPFAFYRYRFDEGYSQQMESVARGYENCWV